MQFINITFFCLGFLALGTSLAAQGDTCGNPIVINANSYSGAHSTCGMADDYQSNASGDYCVAFPSTQEVWISDPEIVFTFTPSVTSCYLMEMDISGGGSIQVFSGCLSASSSACFGYSTTNFGGMVSLDVGVAAGETVFIYGTGNCVSIDLDINPIPAGPANDVCSGALPLAGTGNNFTATCEPSAWTPEYIDDAYSLSCSGIGGWSSNENGVWYTFTNDVMQDVDLEVLNVSCSGGGNDLQIGVWENTGACEIDNANFVSCLIITAGNGTINMPGLPAGDYFVFVDGDQGSDCSWEFESDVLLPPFVPSCDDVFTDSGGAAGNYSNDEDHQYIICGNSLGDIVTVTFSFFDIDDSFNSGCPNSKDYMDVFDGSGTASQIGHYCNEIPIVNGTIFTSTAGDGCLTFVFHSNGSQVNGGWEALVSCESPACIGDAEFITD